ncbi:hypothetical protein HCN44_004731 [Aphidius gifuensis]|uniref:Obg domain-containing protein n=1 Tax=Aphidius gifuensis TaxID=684658 RepID=A0A834Y192_APHGI|nr:hypothetical protein HCN44_004731 [Aphidius gifuensis]
MVKGGKAGPDGGHVIFGSCNEFIIKAEDGIAGQNKDYFGKNADHAVIKVPMGAIVRDIDSNVLADLDEEQMIFIEARGGAGGYVGSIEGMPQPADSGAAAATKSNSAATTTATPADEPSKLGTISKWIGGIIIFVIVLVGVGFALI